MMKSLITVLALSVSAFAAPAPGKGGNGDLKECGADAPKSCSKLPPRSTKECMASISKAWIPIETCTKPTSVQIVTVTQTAKSKFWPTVTSATTSTTTFTKHVNITETKTLYATSTAKYLETKSANVWASVTSTQHSNITTTKVVSTRTTITSTTTKDQTKETCAVRRGLELNVLEERGRNDRLPDDCSCFLTSTSYSGIETYTSTTVTTPTVTKIQTIPASATSTITWTLSATAYSTKVTSSAQLSTKTKTNYVTSIVSVTWTLTAEKTTTQYASATATTTVDVCATAAPLASGLTADNAVSATPAQGRTFEACCRSCFKTPNCVFYDFDSKKKDCTIYVNNKPRQCNTESCPKGKADVWLKPNPQDQFGYGACVGTAS